MRIVRPAPVRLLSNQNNVLTFTGNNSEKFLISILEQDIIHVQHLPDGTPRLDRTWSIVDAQGEMPWEGRKRDDLSGFSRPQFQMVQDSLSMRISTDHLHLDMDLGDCSLTWQNRSDNVTFAADLKRRAYSYDAASETVYHYMLRRTDEHYYGFGEKSGPLDKYGRRMRMTNLDALGYSAKDSDPLYKSIPFYTTFIPSINVAYGLFYDNLSNSTFDMGQELDNYYGLYHYYQAECGDVDYYMIFGPQISDVVKKFSKLIGLPALLPRWSLGYLGSSMLYTDAPDAQEMLNKFMDECSQHQIPCDMFHLSSGYSMGKDGKRYVFTWNRERVPNPEGLMSDFHKSGMHVTANVKPCLLNTHPRFQELVEMDAFIHDSHTRQARLDYFWDGYGSHLDFTNPAVIQWWQENIRDMLLKYGVDAIWNDNNEYEIWDDEALCDGFGSPIKLKYIRPLQSFLMTRASVEIQHGFKPGLRQYSLSRCAAPGTQRYAQTWSGDNLTDWETLRYNIPMGLGMSLSAFPNIGHDVGGFAGPSPSPEMLVRWVQNGIFHPRFTLHSWNTDSTVNTPWMHPEVLPIIRKFIELRYKLFPYLYTRFFEAHRSGEPIIRPLVYQFPQDEKTHQESFDFMCGPDLLVASVLEEGARQRDVYLPAGQEWIDMHSGAYHQGGQTITVPAPLDQIPLFVAAGSVIPQGKQMRHVDQLPDDLRVLHLFPHQNTGERVSRLIEDDGISLAYQQGAYTELLFRLRSTPKELHLDIAFEHFGYELSYKELSILLPKDERRPLQINCPSSLSVKLLN